MQHQAALIKPKVAPRSSLTRNTSTKVAENQNGFNDSRELSPPPPLLNKPALPSKPRIKEKPKDDSNDIVKLSQDANETDLPNNHEHSVIPKPLPDLSKLSLNSEPSSSASSSQSTDLPRSKLKINAQDLHKLRYGGKP